MKLMKLMFAGILVLSFAIAQDENPCDPNMTYEVADPGPDGGCGNYADCNGNGAFDLGEPCFEQPPFDDVDANGDGSIDREEARAFFGDDPNFDQAFDDVDADGSGDVDRAEHDAAGKEDHQDGPPPLPFEQVDANGDGVITEDEAQIMGFFFGDGSCGEYDCQSGKKSSWAKREAHNKNG